MKGLSAALVAACLALPILAASAAGDQPPLGEQDRQFLDHAILGDLAAIAFAQLAERNAENPAIGQFAARMVAAHRRSQQRLAALAAAKGVAPPQQIDKDTRDLRDNVVPVKGRDFDLFYMRHEVAAELKALTLYQEAAVLGRDPAIKGLIAEDMPRLQEQYTLARATEAELPGTAPLMSTSGVVETRQPRPDPFPGR